MDVVLQCQRVFIGEDFVEELFNLILIFVAGLECLCILVLALCKALLCEWHKLSTFKKWYVAENHAHILLSDVSFGVEIIPKKLELNLTFGTSGVS